MSLLLGYLLADRQGPRVLHVCILVGKCCCTGKCVKIGLARQLPAGNRRPLANCTLNVRLLICMHRHD